MAETLQSEIVRWAISLITGIILGAISIWAVFETQQSAQQGADLTNDVKRLLSQAEMKTDELVRIGSDIVNVYHVVSADDSVVEVRRLIGYEELVAAGCTEEDIRPVPNPLQRIEKAEPYASGEFAKMSVC